MSESVLELVEKLDGYLNSPEQIALRDELMSAIRAQMSETTTISDGDVYWDMNWGTCKKSDGSPVFPDKPDVEKQFEASQALARLLAEGVVYLNAYWWMEEWPEQARKITGLFVNCNDVFAWASADAEEMLYEEIQDVYDHWLKDPKYGPTVWCCKKRKEMPQGPVRREIEAAGIWDLSSMGLAPNHYDEFLKRQR